jgi:hypothetical protein
MLTTLADLRGARGRMEPSELYNRNKRNLGLFAALLIIVVLGGIRPEDQGQFFGFKIAAPDLVPVGIWCVTIWCLYQYWFGWTLQADALRSRIRFDFYITAFLAVVAILAYVAFDLAPLLIKMGTGFLLLLLVAVVVVAVVVAYALYRTAELKKWRLEAFSLRKSTIRERLEEPGWVLNFNAKHPKGFKAIEFLEGGAVGQGRNDNEYQWELDGQDLVIRRHDGTLQNRFRYDETTDQFVSTDDREADAVKRGNTGQYIYRSP